MPLNFEEVNILGNIINDTYGKGSTNYGEGGTRYTAHGPGNHSTTVTKSALQGSTLTVTSLSIVNLKLKVFFNINK